ncbi:DUF262 domain-containing protein [Rodentibacter ratti]|uniref:DUF262 domain-containing protein n=1 Tax=Rodentibacter ratti TaxID=1906745 RepID=A0A1V3L6T8_9PAST|nr:DUF262 domain-containing protein [Rodentibacter ratti]OOF85659.1 hypothetical protein BKG88_06625 [Rodentibacter ratti]
MADNKLLSLNEIFNEKVFRIPDFQRGYSWEESQLTAFWEDLQNLKNSRTHYTGLLSVEQLKEIKNDDDKWLFESGLKFYYLIDGQQRLTTSIILIQVILNSLADDEDILFKSKADWEKKFLFQKYKNSHKSYIFGYEKDNPSDEFFKTKILGQDSSTADKVPEHTLYTSNLMNAKSFFEDKITQLNTEEREEVFKKLVSQFKFNFYEIDDELDVFVTFETMNNRGKPLSNLELLKNRLIYLSTLLEIDDNERRTLRNNINEAWKTIYEYLGKNKDKHLNDDDFLSDHWVAYFQYNRKEAQSYAKFLLNEHFTAKQILDNKISFNEIKEYTASLQKLVKSWFYLHNPQFSTFNDDTKEWLSKLNRLSMSSFAPLLMVVLANERDEKEMVRLLKSVERFIFLVFYISQRRSNTANTKIYRYAHEYHNNNLALEQLIENIDYLTDGSYQNDNGEWVYYGWTNIEYFIDYIKDLNTKQQGFYSWNGLRYFLYEYELELQKIAKGDSKVSWQDFSKREKEETIEHIYPQTPDDEYWRAYFPIKSPKQKEIFLHSLGNLVLLSRSKNSELQNFSFPHKKCHTDKNGEERGFSNGSYSEIAVAKNEDWTPKAIKKRGEEMLKFMDKRWNIQFDEWEIEVNDILQLKLD